MRKLFFYVHTVILIIFLSLGLYAGNYDDMQAKEKTKLTKEEKKLKREQKRRQRLEKRDEKKSEKHTKKEKKAEKVKTSKKTKEDRELDKQHKKVKKDIDKKMRKQRSIDYKEEKKLDKIHRIEKRNARNIESENKKKIKNEQHRLKRQQRKETEHMAILKEQKERVNKLAKINADKENNLKLAQTWKIVREDAVKSDYQQGKYADLYMLPAWPVSSWFYKDKALINATAFYHYAIDAYDSEGANKNITTLAFGESPIHVKDIVLASKLFSENDTNVINFRDSSWISPINFLIQSMGDQEIKLHGRTEQYGLSLDFMRHVLRDDISIGIQVPLMFMENRLHVSMDFPTDYDFYNNNVTKSSGQFNEFLTHSYYEALKRIFRAKNIDEFGGSASGLGDITLFGNVEISTRWIEKIVAGFKFVLPTARKSSAHKLWAPQMGNEGCTEIAAFISLLTKYNRYINPHLFLQAGFYVPAHVDRRVPRWTEFDFIGDDSSQNLPIDLMSLADRLQAQQDASFKAWDSTIRGFSDKIVSTKFEKGPELTVNVGNIFDKFLCRRGFMDIFYNLRVKFEDSYRHANRDLYKIDMLEDNTDQVEHRVGFEYSYQFDSSTRIKAGMAYTFAGENVEKAFDLGVSFAHSF